MAIHGVKRIWEAPVFCMRKHSCPVCGGMLQKTEVSKVVNSRSEEAKYFDFSMGNMRAVGNVRFIWTAFHCENCDKQYSVKELKNILREKQRQGE